MDENIDLNEKYLKYFSLKKIYERNKDLLSSTNDFVKYKIFTRDEEFILIDPYEYLKTMNNCFYKFENDDTLLLKCWRNNQLVDVSIIIKKHKNKKFHYSLPI